jgi:alcohol dehydrogenase
MTLTGNWSYPTAVRIGAGRIGELAKLTREAGIARPLVVTDPTLVRLPMLAAAVAQLQEARLACAVFSDIQPNPVDANVAAGVAALRDGRHDGVVAIGGGSALDAGKVIAFMAGQTRPMWDFEDVGDWWMRADADAILPNVCVPTTAGTGSEVGRAGVITDAATATKKVIFHPKMMPRFAICDPALTVGMPKTITVGTGIDALAHCLEAYCSPGYHPLADGIAVEGLRLVKDNLPRVVAEPGDLPARTQMMAAAAMGATAFQKGLGAVHALSHPVGSLHHTHHGMTNAVFLPYVLAFNRPAIEERICRLAAFLGLPASFAAFFDFIMALRRDLGVPHTLEGLGVTAPDIGRMAAMAPHDPTAGGNPVPLDAAAAARLYEQAISGRIAGQP